jgi:hypothetical protein
MRRELVEEVLEAASAELFEDVEYTPLGGPMVIVTGAIFGVELAAERFEMMGAPSRDVSHVTRALKAKFPALTKGDVINDGAPYKVLDWEPIGDGRFEVLISLKPV